MSTETTNPITSDDVALLRPDTLAASVAMLLVLTVGQRLIGFVRGLLICRWLDKTELGQWEMVLTFLAIVAPLTMLGVLGSLGRYVDYYGRRGQLKAFLRRVALFCTIVGSVAAAIVFLAEKPLAWVVFGDSSARQVELMNVVAMCLCGVFLFNFMGLLCTALRMYRVFVGVQFACSALFALFSLGLLMTWRMDASSVIAGYGGACFLTSVIAIAWLRGSWKRLPPSAEPMGRFAVFNRIAPFAIWIWVMELIGNTFGQIDRYFLIHHSGLEGDAALALVGQYHSARVVPLLFATLALMVGNMLTPHLSSDWEAGRRADVVARLNMVLKLMGLALVVSGVIVLAVSPLLFDWFFHGKFDAAPGALPWTLMYCTWFGMGGVAQNYLWCAEKSWLSTLSVLAGLLLNIALNFLVVPYYGLMGAVLVACVANLLTVCLIYAAGYVLGMRFDGGTLLVTALPAILALGAWWALAALVLVAVLLVRSTWILNADEKHKFYEAVSGYGAKIDSVRARLGWANTLS